jgi:hypothetical protein
MRLLLLFTICWFSLQVSAQTNDYRDAFLGYYNVQIVERIWDVTINDGTPEFDTIYTQALVTTFPGASPIDSADHRLTVRFDPSAAELDTSLCGTSLTPILLSSNFFHPMVDTVGTLHFPEFDECVHSDFSGMVTADSLQVDYSSYSQWGGWRRAIIGTRSPSGIGHPEIDASITVYPNPTKDVFNLETSITQGAVTIFDPLGREVLTETIRGHRATFDLSGQPKGVYLIRVSDGSTASTHRVIRI